MAARLTSTLLRTQGDRRLAVLAAQGSEPAFEALIERYRKPLHAYCRRLLLDRTSSEDVVQQAFVSTWQALVDGREIADVRAWLYRVVHNGAVNALRRSGYRHEELSDLLHGSGAPDEDLERRIAVRRALAGLADLPELQREALMRTAVEGRSHVAVALELGVTETAVRGLVYRARVTLRAAATAITPLPLAAALAAAGGRSPVAAERIAELAAGGGGAATALLLKGGATVATVGALAGGAVVSERTTDRPAVDRPAPAQRDAGDDRGGGPGPSRALLALPSAAAGDDAGRSRGSAGVRRVRLTTGSGSGRSSSSGPGPSGAVGDDRSGPSRTSGRSGRSGHGREAGRDDDDDDDRSGPSGPGGDGDDAARQGDDGGRGRGGDASGGDSSGSAGPGGGGGDTSSGDGPSGDASGGDGGGPGDGGPQPAPYSPSAPTTDGAGKPGPGYSAESTAPGAPVIAEPTDGSSDSGSSGDGSSGSGSGTG